ncbi:MAG: hypothetical protein IPO83_11055 [Chitinophagaceae bacterium]|nr:hypothetical protein [Chitinophagaceae bacterium]
MKKILFALAIYILLSACNRAECPAYMNGEATGASGAKGKKQELFPPGMKKK